MGRIGILIKSDLRKNKGKYAVLFLLIVLASAFLNLLGMVTLDYSARFWELHDEANGSHAIFAISGTEADFDRLERDFLQVDAEIESYGTYEGIAIDGTCEFGENRYRTLFFALPQSVAESALLDREQILSDSGTGRGVYLPYDFDAGGYYGIGDTFTIRSSDTEWASAPVRGFSVSTMAGGMRCRICTLVFDDETYASLPRTEGIVTKQISVRLRDSAGAEDFEYRFLNELHAKYPSAVCLTSNNMDTVKSTSYANQVICAAVIGIVGLVFAAVVVIVIGSNISDFIRKNMKNYGMLKAIGYRSTVLRGALLAEFGLLAVLAVLIGAGGANLIFPTLNRMMEAQTGMPFPNVFQPKPFILTLVLIPALVLITAAIASARLRFLPPMAAIRNVSASGKTARNYLPLSSSRLPVNWTLALKTAISGMKQNLVILLVLFGILFGCAFAVVMYENVIADIVPAVELSGHNADVLITVPAQARAPLSDFLNTDPRVDSALMMTDTDRARCNGEDTLRAMIIDRAENVKSSIFCYRGSLPESDTEVALGGIYAQSAGIRIGDTVELEIGGVTRVLTVSGLMQICTNCGNDCVLTEAGFEAFTPMTAPANYYVLLAEGADQAAFLRDVSAANPMARAVDYAPILRGMLEPFVTMMRFVIAGMILCCVFLILFVLIILVRTLLNNKETEYGILKAIGYTTPKLVFQTAGSFLPVVLISLVVSVPAACAGINLLLSTFLHGIGIVQTAFPVDVPLIAVIAVGIAVLSLAVVCLLSIRIRNNTPRRLLTGR